MMYRKFFKRFFDFFLSLCAIAALSPFFLLFTPIVAVAMRGNPFFVQERPGKNAKIFKMIKYRTMTNRRDEAGNLLADADRLTAFGKVMRKLSLDELPELFNILIGNMSIVGPRPLLVQYLPLYSEFQMRRHEVRPGLTGLAQVSGRNAIGWEEKFQKDVEYVDRITLLGDLKIIFRTVGKVFRREGISQDGQATMEFFTGNGEGVEQSPRDGRNVLILSCGRRVELVNLFRKAYEKTGTAGKVIAVDCSDTAPALYFADAHDTVPRISSPDYIDKLKEICRREKVSLVVPTIDTELELLASVKERFEAETGAKLLVSDLEAVKICCDKRLTADFCAERGIAVPRTYTAEELRGEVRFPLFIKPAGGSSSVNAFRVNDRKQLDFFLEYIEDPVVQECADGAEYTIDVFCDFDGNIITAVPRRRLAVRSGEILKGRTEKNRTLIDESAKIVRALGLIGHNTVQGFLGEDGVFRLIEINPRFGGGAPMSIMAGADSCENLLKLLAGERLSYNENYEDGATFVRFDQSIRLKSE